MRIAVLDYYHPTIDFKDPGQITIGLGEAGADTFMIPLNPLDSPPQAPFRIVGADPRSDTFWAHADADVVLFFSRLNPQHTPLVARIKAHGKKVIIKADSDGTLGYPLVPNYLRTLSFSQNPNGWVSRNAKWRLPIKKFVAQKLEQVRLADAVIIESPDALENVRRILSYWGHEAWIKKLYFVPDPVAPEVLHASLTDKPSRITVSIGRWEDEGAKNTTMLVRVLGEFLGLNRTYSSVIIGSGGDKLQHLAAGLPPDIRERIKIEGVVEHSSVSQYLARARIFFVPSRIESFCIAAAEALCMGCSIVATPVEPLKYLSQRGFSGTVARSFEQDAILSALTGDSEKWETEKYDPHEIASFWRRRLDRRKVAAKILKIIDDLKSAERVLKPVAS